MSELVWTQFATKAHFQLQVSYTPCDSSTESGADRRGSEGHKEKLDILVSLTVSLQQIANNVSCGAHPLTVY